MAGAQMTCAFTQMEEAALLTGGPAVGDREISKRMVGCIAEAVHSLNSLSCSTADNTRRELLFLKGQQTASGTTSTQRSCLSRISRLVRDGGSCPSGLTPKMAFEEVGAAPRHVYSFESCRKTCIASRAAP